MKPQKLKCAKWSIGSIRILVMSLCSMLPLILLFSLLSKAAEAGHRVRILPLLQPLPLDDVSPYGTRLAQQGPNRIPNGDFEEPAPARWTTEAGDLWWSPLYFWSTGVAREGVHSVGIINILLTSQGRWISEKVTVTAGTMYSLSGWVRASWAGGGAYISLVFLDSADNIVREVLLGPASAVADWIELSGNIAAPEGAESAQVECILNRQGVVWFDEIELYSQEEILCPVLNMQQVDHPDPVTPPGPLLYRLEYANVGNRDVTSVTIVDTYDDNVTFVEASKTPITGTNNRWLIGNLSVGMEGSLEITVTVSSDLSSTQALLNSVTISASNVVGCPEPIAATVPETTHIAVMSLSVTPELITQTVSTLPSVVTYHLTATNDSILADSVYFSVEGSTDQVTTAVTPTSSHENIQPLLVTVSLPAGLSVDRVETVVQAEAEAGGNPVYAVQVTYFPHFTYLPVILKDYPVGWRSAGLRNYEIIALAARAESSNYLYVGSKHQSEFYVSSDCGASWKEPVHLAATANTRSLAIIGSSVWVGTYGDYIDVCEDTGSSFTCHAGPKNGLANPRIYALLYDSCTESIHAGTGDGTYRYPSDTGDWERTLQGSVVCTVAPGTQQQTLYAGSHGGGVYKSVDGGKSWSEFNRGLPQGLARDIWSIAVDPADQVCAGTSDGVYCESNGEWQAVGLQGKTVYTLAGDNGRGRFYAGTEADRAWVRTGASNWASLITGLQPQKVYRLLIQDTCSFIFAGTDQGVWKHPLDW